MTRLSDLLNAAKGDTSVDVLIDDARRRGVDVPDGARGNMYKALQGKHAKHPTDDVLALWAHVFKVPLNDLRQAVDYPGTEARPWKPPASAVRLTTDQRDALDDLVKAIVAPLPMPVDTDAFELRIYLLELFIRAGGDLAEAYSIWSTEKIANPSVSHAAGDYLNGSLDIPEIDAVCAWIRPPELRLAARKKPGGPKGPAIQGGD